MSPEQMERVIREGWPKSTIEITPEQAHLATERVFNWLLENGED